MAAVNIFLFIGLQCFSLLLTGIVLFAYKRLCGEREEMFEHLGDKGGKTRVRMQYVFIGLYILSTLLILILSSYIFFLWF